MYMYTNPPLKERKVLFTVSSPELLPVLFYCLTGFVGFVSIIRSTFVEQTNTAQLLKLR